MLILEEIGNLIAVDRSLGKHIAACTWSSRLISLTDFNTRSADDKIFRGENEDPEKFLKRLAESLPDKVQLPLINYHRDVGFGINMEDPLPTNDFELTTVDGKRKYEGQNASYVFTFTIGIIGHSASDIHEIGLPLHRYFHENPVFNIPYKLLHNEEADRAVKMNMPATVLEPRNIPFDSTSPVKDHMKQLYSATASFEIKVPVLYMKEIPVENENVDLKPLILKN